MFSVHAKKGVYQVKTGDIYTNPSVQILMTSPYGTENMRCCRHYERSFPTTKKIAKVEEYKECLDNESKGVEVTITELESD